MTIRERVAEFAALTKAHPDERFVCLSVAMERHDLLVAGDALAEAAASVALFQTVRTDTCSLHSGCPVPPFRAALDAWKAAAG